MSAEQSWGDIYREGSTVFVLMRDGWRRGKEVLTNRVWFTVYEDRRAPGEAEKFAAHAQACMKFLANIPADKLSGTLLDRLMSVEAERDALRSALNEAMNWNWLDDDMPPEVVIACEELIKDTTP